MVQLPYPLSVTMTGLLLNRARWSNCHTHYQSQWLLLNRARWSNCHTHCQSQWLGCCWTGPDGPTAIPTVSHNDCVFVEQAQVSVHVAQCTYLSDGRGAGGQRVGSDTAWPASQRGQGGQWLADWLFMIAAFFLFFVSFLLSFFLSFFLSFCLVVNKRTGIKLFQTPRPRCKRGHRNYIYPERPGQEPLSLMIRMLLFRSTRVNQ